MALAKKGQSINENGTPYTIPVRKFGPLLARNGNSSCFLFKVDESAYQDLNIAACVRTWIQWTCLICEDWARAFAVVPHCRLMYHIAFYFILFFIFRATGALRPGRRVVPG